MLIIKKKKKYVDIIYKFCFLLTYLLIRNISFNREKSTKNKTY
jgi:hypothetical protein